MPSSATPNEEGKEFNLSRAEEKILEFWKTNQIFEKTLRQAQGKLSARGKRRKTFVFYEGPPYANGKPGIHHVLARIYKDIILRYKTMRGYYVPRRAGWDTHGLPVEIAAEKALGLKSKKDIEKFGIKRFNEEAKKAVWLYKDEWEKLTERIGYWLDLKNAYITYEPEYIETLWWTLSQIAKKKLLYRGHKVVPWCTRCGTALSSHELALGYKEVEDNSAYVKFKLNPGQVIGNWTTGNRSYILSWTTTPWTLPGNVALAVGNKIQYVATEKNGDELWYAKDSSLAKEFGNIGREIYGKDLVGLEYKPLFNIKPLHSSSSYKIYPADFVITEDGTGVVHAAVMYGEDDYKLGQKVGLPQYHTVDEEGKFTRDVPGFAGLYVKARETEKKLLDYLSANGYLLMAKSHIHEYPFCWRCGTPLLYYARTSWFVAMSKLRAKLLAANKKINWIPEHLKSGRFGEWLREVKDWNLSRERYWGTPLPIWECGKCFSVEVVGSLEELNRMSGGAKNNYWIIRHGEAFHIVKKVLNTVEDNGFPLTEKGKKQAVLAAEKLSKGKKIDLIISSPIERAKETAEIIAKNLGAGRVLFDERLREVMLGSKLEGCHDGKYHELFPTYESKFENRPEGGESLRDLRKRVWEFFKDAEKKYEGKNILLVAHEYPIWMMFHLAQGWSENKAIAEKVKKGKNFTECGEVNKFELKILPRNDAGEVDLHRPFIDEIVLPCGKCASTRSGHSTKRIRPELTAEGLSRGPNSGQAYGLMRRVKEVADVWYDSGAMPFASQTSDVGRRTSDKIKKQSDIRNLISEIRYPADYIAEGMDQTRGWFYTLLAVATALGKKAPYKNVVSLGLINDKFGQKMSKSKGNVVEPWEVINKYGADALRWYFYTVNPPGETKNFDESEIQKTYRRMHLLFWNSLVFLQTYTGRQATSGKRQVTSKNILDRWILARLEETKIKISKNLDSYQIRDAALEIEMLIDDLSRWYIRRSRRRLQKPGKKLDYESAVYNLQNAIYEITKLIAPFTPFFAEILHEKMFSQKKSESIHLQNWPVSNKKLIDKKLLEVMAEVRKIASIALAKRAEAGIKVRQPLARASVKCQASSVKRNKQLVDILKEEINVKEIIFDKNIKGEVELDTVITPELKEEGILRELVRTVQELRQKAGMKPKDAIIVMLELPEMFRRVVLRSEEFFKKEVGARAIEYKKGRFEAEIETKIEDEKVWLAVRKM